MTRNLKDDGKPAKQKLGERRVLSTKNRKYKPSEQGAGLQRPLNEKATTQAKSNLYGPL